MKKRLLIPIFFFLFIFPAISSSQDPGEEVREQIGLDGVQNPDELTDKIQSQYLQREWGKVLQNQTIIGPIHNFFESHQGLFLILLNEKYTFSLTFLLTLILWVYILTLTADALRASKGKIIENPALALLLGLAAAIIVAQLNIINALVNLSFIIVGNREPRWLGFVFWFLFDIIIIVILLYGRKMLLVWIRAKRKAREFTKVKEKTDKTEEFVKGVEEGQKLRDKIVPKELDNQYKPSRGWRS